MIDTATAEKLLYLGIILIIAAIAGGGLDAAGVITVPTLRDWRTQAAVAGVGVVAMVVALIGFSQADQAAQRSAWNAQMSTLAQGTVGIPPPKFAPDYIRFDLVELLNSAGSDYEKNCAIAAFLVEFADRLDKIPDAVKVRMAHPLANNSDVCYAESVSIAQQLQTQASEKASPQAGPVGDAGSPGPLLAARDLETAFAVLAPPDSNIDKVQVATASTARLLESLTSVGDEGYIFLGEQSSNGLDNDRTVDETAPRVGQIVTVRTLVNLRSLGTDTNYRNHSVFRILAPATRVSVEQLTPSTEQFQWARVRVVSLPPQ